MAKLRFCRIDYFDWLLMKREDVMRHRIKGYLVRVVTVVTLFATKLALAKGSGTIPTPPSGDQIDTNNDMLDVFFNLFKDKIGPILIYGGAIYMVYMAVMTIIHGINESKEKGDWSKFKMSILYAAIMFTIGVSLGYVGINIFSNMKEGTNGGSLL